MNYEEIQNNTKNKALLEQSQTNEQDQTLSFLQETGRNQLNENKRQNRDRNDVSNSIGITIRFPESEKHAFSISCRSNQQSDGNYGHDENTYLPHQKDQISEDQTNTLSQNNDLNQIQKKQKSKQSSIKIQSSIHPYFENGSEKESIQKSNKV